MLALYRDHMAEHGASDAFIRELVRWDVMKRWAKVICSALGYYPY